MSTNRVTMLKMPILALIIGIFFQSTPLQAEDWGLLFRRQASSEGPAIRQQADRQAGMLMDELVQKKASEIQSDVRLIAAELNSGDKNVRFKASAFLLVLAMSRPDSGVALEPAIPQLILGFKDSDSEVRRSSVLAIGNLKPRIPENAIIPFAEVLKDANPETVRVAAAGLATFCGTSQVAAGELGRLLQDQSKARRRTALEVVGWAGCDNSEVLIGLGYALRDQDNTIVVAAIQTATKLGPKAKALRAELETLARRPDAVVAAAATSALSKVR